MDKIHGSPTIKKNIETIIKKKPGSETSKIPSTILDKLANMVCYYRVGKEWQSKEFSSKKTRYCIGTSGQDSEICISEPEADRIQVVVQKLGGSWFAMEYARTNLLHINGIPNFQFVFEHNGYCTLKIGDSKLVLVLGNNQFKMSQKIDPQNKFVLKNGETLTSFNSQESCLIGSQAICDLVITEEMIENNSDPILKEPFLAMINSYNNQLFIEPLSDKFPLLMQGAVITEPTPICEGSRFSIGELGFSIPESTTVAQAGDFMDFSAAKKKKYMLLQVLGEGAETAINIELPRPGKAVTIGRSTEVTYTISELSLSKQHVQLIVYEKSVLAADLNSTNGTYVNDEKVKKKLMHAGDFLALGDYIFFLSYNDD